MNKFRHQFLRKPTAVLVMGLMIFINGVKLFHTHPDFHHSPLSLKVKPNTFQGEISQSNHCPICEFNLMKDADIAHAEVTLFVRISAKVLFTTPLPPLFHHFAIYSQGRAPPVFLS